MTTLSATDTAALLPYAGLVAALREAALELAAGSIACPQRQVIAMGHGALLSMAAVAKDLGVHKLVTVVPENRRRGLPTIQGQVSVMSAATGELLLSLDGAMVTGRRTAALSMLGVASLSLRKPRRVRIYGTGTQAFHHLQALAALYPAARVEIVGRTPAAAVAFCAAHADTFQTLAPAQVSGTGTVQIVDGDVDLVLTCTTSPEPVYRAGARAGRLVIAVGAYTPVTAEIDAATVRGSTLYVDDLTNARHEAGDLIRAKVDWAQVRPIADAIGAGDGARAGAGAGPILFKTVGSAAWDLAAARVAVAAGAVTNLS